MTGGAEINNYPAGTIPGFRFIDAIDVFGDDSYVLITTSGVFVTTNIAANPIEWTPLGAATTPANVNGVKASVASGTPSFIIQAGNCDGRSQDRLWRFNGTGAGSWTQINRPDGTGGFGIFDVDPTDPNRIIASHLRTGLDPQMVITTDGGAAWTNLPALDTRMTGGGAFKYVTTRGAYRVTSHSGYVQPTLVAFNPYDKNSIVAGAMDAGVFISHDKGSSWTLLTYPNLGFGKGPFFPGAVLFGKFYKPQIPRPWHAYFEKRELVGSKWKQNIYIGTMGRGAWRISVSQPSPLIDFCKIKPWICFPIEFQPPFMVINWDGRPGIGTIDVPEICKRVINCPGCDGRGLCPPYYNFAFEGLPFDQVEVIVYDPKGNAIDAHFMPGDRGRSLAVSFRPDKRDFKEREIGDYKIAFVLGEKMQAGRFKISMKLSVSDEPFDMKGEPIDLEDLFFGDRVM
jgi:hypothetical protein